MFGAIYGIRIWGLSPKPPLVLAPELCVDENSRNRRSTNDLFGLRISTKIIKIHLQLRNISTGVGRLKCNKNYTYDLII